MGKFLVFFLCLTSCHKVSGNDIDFCRIIDAERNGDIIETFMECKAIEIDFKNKTVIGRPLSEEEYQNLDNIFGNYCVNGSTAPHYHPLETDEKCNQIIDDIKSLNTLDERSVFTTLGFYDDCYVYGICNVYYDTIGYLSGGGNIGEEEIAYSILYKYDFTNDKLETILRLENSTMVAFNKDYVVFWKDRVFYSRNILNGNEIKLCDHLSYDRGIQHQSVTKVTFNSKFALIYMEKRKSNDSDIYFYFYEFGGDVIQLDYNWIK